jgi:hypothetical protein
VVNERLQLRVRPFFILYNEIMFKKTTLVILLTFSHSSFALAEQLNGEVSEEGQARIQRVDANGPGQAPMVAPDRREGYAQSAGFVDPSQNEPLVGNASDFALPPQRNQQRPLMQAGAQNQLSALGVAFKFSSGRVIAVDPGSDLYGQIFPGDRIISYDGMNPVESYRSGSNFGNAGTVVQLTFEHGGLVRTLPCRRKPVSEFSPAFQSELNWGALHR